MQPAKELTPSGEVGFAEIAINLPQARFWTTSSTVDNGWERYRPLSFIIDFDKLQQVAEELVRVADLPLMWIASGVTEEPEASLKQVASCATFQECVCQP
jgi:hypothetical protein